MTDLTKINYHFLIQLYWNINYCGPLSEKSLLNNQSPDMTPTAHDRPVLFLLVAPFTIGVKRFHQGKLPAG